MSFLAPLAFAVPLVGAALLAALHPVLSRLACDVLGLAVAAGEIVMLLLLLLHVQRGLSVYWFGGWHPRAGVAIGIDFTVEPVGCALAVFVSVLMLTAFLFSTRFMGVKHPYYHVLMLTFMAGMVGFCLSGDIFNMFVMFEVMSISAVALIGYKVDERAALEGALNFAVMNMIGSFLFLLGIGLLYARTGALNLAQIGRSLEHHEDDRVVIVAFALIACALLVKAAVVPFHFWLSDAYSVALAPVCIILAGAMSEIGLYGLGRVWFSAFQPALAAHVAVMRAIFVGAGILTALVGAVMALGEDHLKRMLAFITISFVGVFLTGVGLLTAEGVAGASVYVVADGFDKGLLFACVGIVQTRLGRVGQDRLHGKASHLVATGALFAFGGLLLASLPPFGPFLGKSMIDDAAIHAGYGFVPPFVVLAAGLSGAAVLRASARIFLGWGRRGSGASDVADEDTRPEAEVRDRTPAVMLIAALLLGAGAIGTGVWFGFADLAASAARRFTDVSAYRAAVFGSPRAVSAATSDSPQWYDWLYGGGSTVLALAIAAVSLRGEAARRRTRSLVDAASRAVQPLKRIHTGRIGDYVAALFLGLGVLGALMMLALR